MTWRSARAGALVGLALACAGCEGVAVSGGVAAPGEMPAAADGRDVAACFDGNCEILLDGPTTIPLDERFGFARLSFDPADSTWRYTYSSGGGGKMRIRGANTAGSWIGAFPGRLLKLTVVGADGARAVVSLGARD